MDKHLSNLESLQFHIAEDEQGYTVKSYLRGKRGISRRIVTTLKQAGNICLNGRRVYLDHPVAPGDIITLVWPEEQTEYIEPQPMALDIRYEDEHLMVINKPPGITVHPTMGYKQGTLANAVVHYWQEKGLYRKFRPVNRLDKDTSGLLIVAKNAWSHQQLSLVRQSGGLRRIYYAIVHGSWNMEEMGSIDLPIGRKDDSIIEREVRSDGQRSVTHWRVLQRGLHLTMLELRLETGRTHQIRVHMSYLGHPLAGDDLYGGKRDWIDRQALHAYAIHFHHPLTGDQVMIEAELPEDMRKLCEHME